MMNNNLTQEAMNFFNAKVKKEMPLGSFQVTFESVRYTYGPDGFPDRVWISSKEFDDISLKVFKERNTQLNYLCQQLGVDTYAPDNMNGATGTVITVTRYESNGYKNISFNPFSKREEVSEDALL